MDQFSEIPGDVDRTVNRTESAAQLVVLRPFQQDALQELLTFWNEAFADRRNFHPISEREYRRRVLLSPAFDPDGLILAWQTNHDGADEVVGLVHAFRPPPRDGLYLNWEPAHYIAVLYVRPDMRKQGIGARLLQAAENWLYYCPVHMASHGQPCYGYVEGPRAPFFGSTERMGVSIREQELIRFLARRGYLVTEPGDVSMALDVDAALAQGHDFSSPPQPDLASLGLRQIEVSHEQPFQGTEPGPVKEYSLWGANDGDPYTGILLVDGENILRGHISWYPMPEPGKVALGNFGVDPELRHRGLGNYLLDLGLYRMIHDPVQTGGDRQAIVELHTHLDRNAQAVRLYRRRGFEIVDAWVNLVKT